MYTFVSFTVAELFEKVWQMPMVKLAHEIGVSDVAVAKACRKAGIPLPGRGHWAKSEKQRQRQPKPPQVEGKVRFQMLDRDTLPAKTGTDLNSPVAQRTIDAPSQLTEPHALVSQWLKSAKTSKFKDGYLDYAGKRVLNVMISSTLIERCAILFDALIKEGEAEGYSWKINAEGKTITTVNGETMAVRLIERLDKRALPPPPPPKRRPGAPWEPNFMSLRSPQFEWTSTGELTFQIEARMDYGERKNWKDTKTAPLEKKLSSILAGLSSASVSIKVLREKEEARDREWAEDERRRLERARTSETQRHLRRSLVKHTEQWERAERLRAFIKAVEDRLKIAPLADPEMVQPWIDWARKQADLLDPLQESLALITTLDVQLENWFSGSHYGQVEKGWWPE
ncbi:hypothetical protein [Pseudomonas frederiksbergensis]|uniref:hypothetical protein n=1 Tax=Pseudomonas frederiksbergensis TaxID=104087 RepID=UPI000F4964F8|nr:hypothetical protein [Pseudomonas frederiksbergensis]RON56160.1 hypothetical protein BK667_07365 [Pseudomonas frederiksbergensis]